LESLKVIAVDGPPGSGKTALARALAERLDARLVLDRVEDNPFLSKFLEDASLYALPAQVSFLLSRYKQQGEIAQPELFQQKTVTNYTLISEQVFAQVTLSEEEYGLYLHLQSVLAKNFVRPDLALYTHARPETLSSRLGGDDPLRSVEGPSIEQLAEAYDAAFAQYESSPLLTVETDDLDLRSQPIDIDALLEEIKSMAGERSTHTPVPRPESERGT